ncbi:hypothetical protein Tco_0858585 [Tanacetum coccineum]|uniref:Uncharacterized protein n=1 Tax=Tanacetum coccineum TaxID=301880 RepID=A0ABQ5BAJ5_9ASTR
MDWLAYNPSISRIDMRKIVHIPLPKGEILEVQGERTEKGSLDHLHVSRLMRKSFMTIRIDPNFPEFVRSPYRLALFRKLELSNQLKNSREGFILPTSLTMGARCALVKNKTGACCFSKKDLLLPDNHQLKSEKKNNEDAGLEPDMGITLSSQFCHLG